jgi:DNA polymerase-3 subunit delta
MGSGAVRSRGPLALICGEDDFSVMERAKELYRAWTAEIGGMDHEIIDATISNSDQGLKALARLREALRTLPFFGSGKVVWLKDCNFLGDDRTSASERLTDALVELAQELKVFTWDNVRLLISAGKVDKRKTFYKTIEKLGQVESFTEWSVDTKDWSLQARKWALKALEARGKEISEEALEELISRVGPNARQIESEVEKLSLHAGDRRTIEFEEVAALCTRNKAARAYALADALGNRDLPELLRRLDEELWEVKLDPRKSEIGLLYGLISKVRAMILLKEMLREGWIKPARDYPGFKAQLERVPVEQLPQDRKFNPLAINAYVLYKALPQVNRYTQAELIRAMELLLECNRLLVTTGLDQRLVLQRALVEIVSQPAARHAERVTA